jgi:transglutaminase-like putative cysteine protease
MSKYTRFIIFVLLMTPILIGCAKVADPTSTIDYNMASVQDVAKTLDKGSSIATIWATALWVEKNIDYRKEGFQTCVDTSATEVLARKWGDCSGMSKLVTALLEANRIPSCVMQGCASTKEDVWAKCGAATFAIMPAPEARVPKTSPIELKDGLPVIAGGAHAWVKAWTGINWVYIEPTAGAVLNSDCGGYMLAGLNQCLDGSVPQDHCVIWYGPYQENKNAYTEFLGRCTGF